MATKALEGLGKLEDQLTCPICLDHFSNPKILPCFHSFCMGCLEGIKTHNGPQGTREIFCPTCRLPCPILDKGLPASFVINNLIEVYGLMKKVSGDSRASCDNCGDQVADRYCKQCAKFFCQQCLHHHNNWKPNANHDTITLEEVASTAYQLPTARPEITEQCVDHNKPLEIFCETCQELICHNCTVKKHRDHDYDVASDVYCKNRDDIIESSLKPLNSEVDRIIQAMKLLETQRVDVTDQAKKTREEIQRKIQNRLEEMSKKLKEEVATGLKYTVSMLDDQIKEAKGSLDRMTECRDHVEQCVKVGTPRQILTTKAQMIERAKKILEEVKDKTFERLEEADIKLIQEDVMDTFDTNIGRVISGNHNSIPRPSLPSNNLSKRSSFPLVSDQPINNSVPTHSPVIGQDSVITVSLTFPDGSPVPSSLIECTSTTSSNNGRPIPCPLVDGSRLGLYNIVFTPFAKGNHQLQFKVNIPISVATEINTAPICPPNGKLNGPSGIAFTDQGLVVVCESYGSCIKVLDNQGGVVKSFSTKGTKRGELQRPQGIVVMARGTVLVADWYNHRIQEFTLEGVCKACIGTKGNGKLQFCYPVGMAVSKKTGQIFVAELGNSRIQVLNSNLTFSHMFGSKGKEQWQFQELHDVAIDPDGFVYTTDRLSNSVKKFSTDGNFVASFNTEDAEEGEMLKPSGITVANDLLFINNEDRYITVLTTTGEHFGFIDKSPKEMITNSGFPARHCV